MVLAVQTAKDATAAVVSAPQAPTQSDHTAIMVAVGIAPADYSYVEYIIGKEGHWCPTIWEGESGCPAYHGTNYYRAYGICQALEPGKMATAGPDWETNVVTQLRWCDMYAHSAKFVPYGGGWRGAYNYWVSHNYW